MLMGLDDMPSALVKINTGNTVSTYYRAQVSKPNKVEFAPLLANYYKKLRLYLYVLLVKAKSIKQQLSFIIAITVARYRITQARFLPLALPALRNIPKCLSSPKNMSPFQRRISCRGCMMNRDSIRTCRYVLRTAHMFSETGHN
jgi:hypothetical protein